MAGSSAVPTGVTVVAVHLFLHAYIVNRDAVYKKNVFVRMHFIIVPLQHTRDANQCGFSKNIIIVNLFDF